MALKRIPRKKGQPAKSKKHSDLYTDEDPRGTIKGLKFATVKDARESVAKINRQFIEEQKKKTKIKNAQSRK